MLALVVELLRKILGLQSTQEQSLTTIVSTLQAQTQALTTAATNLQVILSEIATNLQTIIKLLTPTPAVSFDVQIESTQTKQGEREAMPTKATVATVDFQLLDNGTAKATITNIVDAAGLATSFPAGVVPTWVSSDPGVVVTPAADGMSATIAPATPPVLVTGAVITASVVLPTGTISASGEPIDVIAGGPTGFSIAEQ